MHVSITLILNVKMFTSIVNVTLKLEDTLWAGLTDLHIKMPMGITAENLADKYQITREECDQYAYHSQQKWKAGWNKYLFYIDFSVCVCVGAYACVCMSWNTTKILV